MSNGNVVSLRSHATGLLALMLIGAVALLGQPAQAQPATTNLQGFGLKIFKVESGLYPFVQVYFRSFDQEMRPLVNLNELNIGVMVKGHSYDPAKRQYRLMSVRNREEATRTVIVMDCSKSLKDDTLLASPFDQAVLGIGRFITDKRPQDQIAILAVRDTEKGYEIVSNFERDSNALSHRVADMKCDGEKTRLYDTIGAALQMCALASEGGATSADADYIVSNSIIVFSDGKDEGSALSRDDLNGRITKLTIPVPIYSIAYSKSKNLEYFKNLEALSKNSFGVYYPMDKGIERLQKTFMDVQDITQNDYVLTIRSYIPVDGENHNLKIGIEYPSRSGKMIYQSTTFEAVEPPPVKRINELREMMDKTIPAAQGGFPYFDKDPTAPRPADEKGDKAAK